MKKILVIILCKSIFSSTLFFPDSDTAALIAIVSNTTTTVTNTLNLLETAKETAEKMEKYNNVITRKYNMAQRIIRQTEELIDLRKGSIKNLKEVNKKIRRLKAKVRELKSNAKLVRTGILKVKKYEDKYDKKIDGLKKELKEVHRQEKQSFGKGTTALHTQNIAVNTSMSNRILLKSRKDALDFHLVSLSLEKYKNMNKLREESAMKKWAGIKDE